MTGLRNHVVAGVAGGRASRDAVAYAAHEAALRGTALELVHVIPPDLPLRVRPLQRPGSLQAFGSATLKEAERVALEAARVPVTLTLTSGRRAESLLTGAERAALLVVGAPRAVVSARPHPGSVVTAAVLDAPCPAVVVPCDGWPQTSVPRVVVGLKWPPHGDEALLGEAFDLAERRHCDVKVVHACKVHPAHGDLLAQTRHDPGWMAGLAALIDDRLAPLRRGHPAVRVGVDVVCASPGEALSSAALPGTVVLLSRTTGWWPGRVLGPTTRGVLQHAQCPVEVVPVTFEHEPDPRHPLARSASAAPARSPR